MDNSTEELYKKYMSFNEIMLEDHDIMEIAAILIVQGLSIYRSTMTDNEYLQVVDSIYSNRFNVKTFGDPSR